MGGSQKGFLPGLRQWEMDNPLCQAIPRGWKPGIAVLGMEVRISLLVYQTQASVNAAGQRIAEAQGKQ